eukprot:159409-Amphidinium_carterae.1
MVQQGLGQLERNAWEERIGVKMDLFTLTQVCALYSRGTGGGQYIESFTREKGHYKIQHVWGCGCGYRCEKFLVWPLHWEGKRDFVIM